MTRYVKGWTQEDLANASGLCVRTIQRIERGKKVTPYAKDAVFRAFGIKDKGFFEKPMQVPNIEKIQNELDLITLQKVSSGKQLRQMIEASHAHLFHSLQSFFVKEERVIAELKDFITNYIDCCDLYSEVAKVDADCEIQTLLDKIISPGLSIAFAMRKAYLERYQSSLFIIYIVIGKSEEFPGEIYVQKKTNFSI